jgi:CRP-like cAMP-binding protein
VLTQLFKSVAKPLSAKKGEFLLRQGEQNDAIYWIEKGLLKAFYQTHEGNEWVKSFLVEGDVIGSLQAILNRNGSSFSLLCLEDCHLWQIPGNYFLLCMNDKPEYVQPINQILIRLAMKKEQREYELLCLSAEERYQLFCQGESHLLTRLSQQEIAKYIGITAVALSRIRKRLGLIQDVGPESESNINS